MAWKSSVYDHFTIRPPRVALTFSLPEQMFQMNNCARLFLKPCINVDVMTQAMETLWPRKASFMTILYFNL